MMKDFLALKPEGPERVGRNARGLCGPEGAHLKLQVESGSARCEAIWWRQGELVHELSRGELVDLAVSLEQNAWNGNLKLQMVIEDMRPSVVAPVAT